MEYEIWKGEEGSGKTGIDSPLALLQRLEPVICQASYRKEGAVVVVVVVMGHSIGKVQLKMIVGVDFAADFVVRGSPESRSLRVAFAFR